MNYFQMSPLTNEFTSEVHSPKWSTVKPLCNDHLYNNIYYLWFIQ